MDNSNDPNSKIVKELEEIVKLFKKPIWKVVLGLVIVSSLINICYGIGFLLGLLLGKL